MPNEAWVPCPGGCGEFWCRIHRQHAFECPCPAIEEWECDPYASGGPESVEGDLEVIECVSS